MSIQNQLNTLVQIYIRNEKAYIFYSEMTEKAKRYCLGYDFYRTMKKEKETAEKRMKSAIERYVILQNIDSDDDFYEE
jgi:hypothetical protein